MNAKRGQKRPRGSFRGGKKLREVPRPRLWTRGVVARGEPFVGRGRWMSKKPPWRGEEHTRRKAAALPCGDARAPPGRFLPRFPTLPVRSGGGPLPSWGSRYGAPSKTDGTPGGGWGILIKPFSFVGAVLCSKGIFLEGGPHDTFGPPLRPKPHSGHAAGACRKTPGRCTSRTPRGSRGPGAGGAEAEGISPGTGGPPESFSR